MKTKYLKITLLILLLYFFSVIRLHEYERIPGPNHAEELLYGWSGLSLVQTGTPVSWSTLDYPDSNLVFDGTVGDKNNLYLPAKLYSPWLDEPPLYSVLVGLISNSFQDQTNLVIPTAHSRIPTVITGIITIIVIFFYVYKYFDYWTAIISICIYGSSPIMVFGSRLSVPENITALALLILLFLTSIYQKNNNKLFPIVSSVLIIITGLMKPTGFFLAPLAIFICLKYKRWSHISVIITSLLIGIGLFIAYGYYYDWELFKQIVSIQGARFAGWSGLPYILVTPAYDIFEFIDGWYILALLTGIYLVLRPSTNININNIKLFFIYWLLVATFGGTEQDLLPWYWYPIFPLISISGGIIIKEIILEPNFYRTSLIVGLLLSSRFLLHNEFRPQTNPWVFRISFFTLILPSLLYLHFPHKILKQLSQVIVVTIFIIGVFLNSKYIYSAFAIRCESKTCPIGPSTKLSETKLPFFWRVLIPGPPPQSTTATGF